jgi:hypothetical protein
MVKKGMITFGALGDYRNAIVLCGSCHNHYDRTSNTGWVFLPARIDWIIRWEEEDYKDRQETLERTGRVVERSYPNEEDYERYMREIGLLTDPEDGLVRGGLYHSYILEDMFPPLMMEALKQHGMETPGIMPGGPKRWHGAPMAAINRGFVVTGAPEMKLPEKEWEQLRTLQRLYSRKLTGSKNQNPLSNNSSQESTQTPQLEQDQSVPEETGLHTNLPTAPQIPVSTDQTQSGKEQDALEEDPQAESLYETHSRRGRTQKRRYANSADIDGYLKRTCKRRDIDQNKVLGVEEESWCFGPGSTSEQKVHMLLSNLTTVQ